MAYFYDESGPKFATAFGDVDVRSLTKREHEVILQALLMQARQTCGHFAETNLADDVLAESFDRIGRLRLLDERLEEHHER